MEALELHYAHCLHEFCYGFTHILQGYFIETGAVVRFSNGYEVTPKNMNKLFTKIPKHLYYKHNKTKYKKTNQINGLAQDCSNSSALAMELLQSCAKPSTYFIHYLASFIAMESWSSQCFCCSCFSKCRWAPSDCARWAESSAWADLTISNSLVSNFTWNKHNKGMSMA